MRKIVVAAQVSIDGVVQAPGGRDEDRSGGFKLGGWAMPYGDRTAFAELMRLFRGCDLLLGRKTYDIFSEYWPHQKASHGGITETFNRAKKYVVSRSGRLDTSWNGCVRLRSLTDVRRLKRGRGRPLLTQGSTELVHALFVEDLVDAMTLFTVPVVLGRGKKLFADGSVPHAYKLTRFRQSADGMLVSHYERGGAVKTAD